MKDWWKDLSIKSWKKHLADIFYFKLVFQCMSLIKTKSCCNVWCHSSSSSWRECVDKPDATSRFAWGREWQKKKGLIPIIPDRSYLCFGLNSFSITSQAAPSSISTTVMNYWYKLAESLQFYSLGLKAARPFIWGAALQDSVTLTLFITIL